MDGSGPDRISRVALACALVLTLAWAVVYARYADQQLCDEPGHMGAIYHFAQGKKGWPEAMPMMPGYHYTVVALGLGKPTPTTARLTSALFGVSAIVAFAAAWRRLHGSSGGLPALVLALLPILQPFMGMAYSDAAGVAVLLWAAWAQIAEHRRLAAVLCALACLTRQTNLIWVAFFAAWEASRSFGPGFFSRLPSAIADTWRRAGWLIMVIAAAIAAVLYAGRLTPGVGHGNNLRPNIATLHTAGWLFVGFACPLLIRHARNGWDALKNRFQTQPAVSIAVTLASLLAALVLGLVYQNPHIWNQVLTWPEVSFTLLRNWPLVWMDHHVVLRYFSGLAIVAGGWVLVALIRGQEHRFALALLLLFSVILLGTNYLVEPRYFITPAAMLLLYIRLDRRDYIWLTAWFFLLNLVHAPFILGGRALW